MGEDREFAALVNPESRADTLWCIRFCDDSDTGKLEVGSFRKWSSSEVGRNWSPASLPRA
jgi:hypothetical protein